MGLGGGDGTIEGRGKDRSEQRVWGKRDGWEPKEGTRWGSKRASAADSRAATGFSLAVTLDPRGAAQILSRLMLEMVKNFQQKHATPCRLVSSSGVLRDLATGDGVASESCPTKSFVNHTGEAEVALSF